MGNISSFQQQATTNYYNSCNYSESFQSEAGEEANDEAENFRGLFLYLNLLDAISHSIACIDSDVSTPSVSDSLSLPWYGDEHPAPLIVQQPSVIETSKWTKIAMGKACKAFGVNIAGFEHELLDLILRMEQKRQTQLSKGKSSDSARSRGKRKRKSEVLNLVCSINYERSNKKEGGRQGRKPPS